MGQGSVFYMNVPQFQHCLLKRLSFSKFVFASLYKISLSHMCQSISVFYSFPLVYMPTFVLLLHKLDYSTLNESCNKVVESSNLLFIIIFKEQCFSLLDFFNYIVVFFFVISALLFGTSFFSIRLILLSFFLISKLNSQHMYFLLSLYKFLNKICECLSKFLFSSIPQVLICCISFIV